MSLVIVRDLYKCTCICILLSSCFKIVLCLWNKNHIFCGSNHFLRLAWLSLHCDLRIYCSCTPQTQNNTRLKSLWKRDLKTQISFFPVCITQILKFHYASSLWPSRGLNIFMKPHHHWNDRANGQQIHIPSV